MYINSGITFNRFNVIKFFIGLLMTNIFVADCALIPM